MKTQKSEKKVYVAPELIVHGTVEEITADQNKKLGLSDGFLFMGKSEVLVARSHLFVTVDLKRRVFARVLQPRAEIPISAHDAEERARLAELAASTLVRSSLSIRHV